MSTVYVVEMLRWGDRELHSYVVGVYTSPLDAVRRGSVEEAWRGGKYDYEITKMQLDQPPNQEQEDYYQKCGGDDE